MQFQAPYDIMDMRNQRMKEDALRQEQSMAQQEQIFGALGQLAGVFQEQETMKASVKSGEQMLKMFGGQLGIDSKILSSPEYKSMGMRGQAALHGNLWGSLGAISNMRMANARFGLQQNAPYVDQLLDNQRDVAGGKATWTPGGGGGGGNTPAPVEPPLPGEEPLNPPPAVTAPGPVANPITDASRQRAMTWWQKRSQGGP